MEKHNKNEHYVLSPPPVYEKIFDQTNAKSPIVFILSPGADPVSDVQKLAEIKGFSGHKFKSLSLGQGMGSFAEEYLKSGS